MDAVVFCFWERRLICSSYTFSKFIIKQNFKLVLHCTTDLGLSTWLREIKAAAPKQWTLLSRVVKQNANMIGQKVADTQKLQKTAGVWKRTNIQNIIWSFQYLHVPTCCFCSQWKTSSWIKMFLMLDLIQSKLLKWEQHIFTSDNKDAPAAGWKTVCRESGVLTSYREPWTIKLVG